MAESRSAFIREVLKPVWVRVMGAITVLMPVYDVCCNQFGWPKLPRLWGMSGSLMPWWGWLLVLQAVLVAALFDYVRKRSVANSDSAEEALVEQSAPNQIDGSGPFLTLEKQVRAAQDVLARTLEDQGRMSAELSGLAKLVNAHNAQLERHNAGTSVLEAAHNQMAHQIEALVQQVVLCRAAIGAVADYAALKGKAERLQQARVRLEDQWEAVVQSYCKDDIRSRTATVRHQWHDPISSLRQLAKDVPSAPALDLAEAWNSADPGKPVDRELDIPEELRADFRRLHSQMLAVRRWFAGTDLAIANERGRALGIITRARTDTPAG